ncbi:ribonucleoside diphosphate reductase beta subunit [Indivirus ILV1]|uniref:Ribonucleoside-diphosphate reductase small chain n=1 Tax=Indivirus ILV1 TaxID=1977633 RepID=A0A1V0SDH7_9VIRU|nr:ribonucleoside diphosphate reductase beta subunit [Indivirus ILV1]
MQTSKLDITQQTCNQSTMQNSNHLLNPMMQEEIEELIRKYGYDKIMTTVDNLKPKNKMDVGEPILDEANMKFTALPITYQSIWKLYKEQMAAFWKEEEVDLSNDYDDFLTLNSDEQYFIEMILAFFAAQDGIVNMNLSERFINEVKITEIIYTYQWQAMMENIHSTMYALMLENIVKDKSRREFLFDAIKNIPSVKAMADWAFRWIDSQLSFAHRLIAFAIVEGIFFSGAFAAIYWIKGYKNKNRDMAKGRPFMDGLNKSNKFIQRDEAMHCRFACLVYSLLKKKLPEIEVKELIDEGVKLSQDFMTNALRINLIGMNSEMMCEYLEYIGDILLVMLGYTKKYNKKNPFKFMENIGLSEKTNFFETRPHEYQDAFVMNTGNKSNIVINEEDF